MLVDSSFPKINHFRMEKRNRCFSNFFPENAKELSIVGENRTKHYETVQKISFKGKKVIIFLQFLVTGFFGILVSPGSKHTLVYQNHLHRDILFCDQPSWGNAKKRNYPWFSSVLQLTFMIKKRLKWLLSVSTENFILILNSLNG